jgi:hypothetical protein
MNTNELISLAPAVGALLIAAVLTGILVIRRSRQMKRVLAASEDTRKMIESVLSELAQMKTEAEKNSLTPDPAPRNFVPAPLLTADQRSGAFDMLRRGAGTAEISAAIGISGPEAEVLLNVQKFLSATPVLS